MTTIREATAADLADLARLGREFYAEAQLGGEYSERRFREVWSGIFDAGLGAIFMAENGDGQPIGAVGLVVAPDLFTEDLVADETFWFVSREHRGGSIALRLLREFERYAESRGAARQNLVHLDHLSSARLGDLYERRGYRVIQSTYQREVP